MSQSPGYYVQITSRRRLSRCSIPLWRYSTVIDDNESTVQSHCSGELRKTTHLQRPIAETVSTGNASILLVYRYPWLVPSVVRPLKKIYIPLFVSASFHLAHDRNGRPLPRNRF